MKRAFFTLLKRLELIPNDALLLSDLPLSPCAKKRLDEFRELIERIEDETQFFSSSPSAWFSKSHAQDTDRLLAALQGFEDSRATRRFSVRPQPECIKNVDGLNEVSQ
ncbi:hypothetical protein KEC58_22205 (plasmid) [Photobacterium damselae]|uniref:hypothetical protein n=1 Tax=Photobacterium damselae TaxID=38293 RepID=UPI0025429F0A